MGFIRRQDRSIEGSRRSNRVQVQPQQEDAPVQPSPDENALQFLDLVESEFSNEPQKYDEFTQILIDFRNGRIGRQVVIDRVKVLFDGHPDLIIGFNQFLPEGYKIDIA